MSKMSNVDIQIWLEGDIYLNVDKMSRAAGLEVRMPLTDTRISALHPECRPEYKVNEEQNKVAFRTAAAKVLPEEIAFRKKLGFIVPIRIWMADERYIRMCVTSSTATWQPNSSIWMRSMRFLRIISEETRITGEKCGQFIHSLYGMRNTL